MTVDSRVDVNRLGAGAIAPTAEAMFGREEALVAACKRGDRTALEFLYRLYSPRLFSVVCRLAGYDDAEEILQEVFLRVFRGIVKFRGDSKLGTWLYRLAVNASLTYLTSKKRHSGRMFATENMEDYPDKPPVSGGALDRISLERAVAALPPGYRTVLVLHDVEGLSHDEIADIMGWHRGTSKSQLHKARAKMRALLTEDRDSERSSR